MYNEDYYKHYIEKVRGARVTEQSITTEIIDRFIESDDTERNFNLDYKVLLKHKWIDDDECIDYYYKPYIVLKKIDPKSKSQFSITMTELKQITHKVNNCSDVLDESYTYLRQNIQNCLKDESKIVDLNMIVGFIDISLWRGEEKLKEEIPIDEDTLFEIFAKQKSIESLFKYFENAPNIIVRAQDTELHNKSFGECYLFKIVDIGAQYFSVKNPTIEKSKRLRSLYSEYLKQNK